MNILIIGYDAEQAKKSGTTDQIISTIKAQSSWARLTSGMYAVTSPLSAAQMRDKILSNVGPNDRVIVYLVNDRYWASYGIPKDVNEWLHKNWKIS
jgi:hypothetical protein